MSINKPSGLTIAIVTGVLTILGAASGSIIKSFSDISLERTKLDSQLILNALKSDSLEERRNTLLFLVDTNLIANKDTLEGLKLYLEGSNPKTPPHIQPFIYSGESRHLDRIGEKLAQKTDVDIFVCGKDNTNIESKKLVQNANEELSASMHFGVGNLKVWDKTLYEEIPLSALKGKTTVVMDFDHSEFGEKELLSKILDNIPRLPKSVFVKNKGKTTPWRVSVILCAK
ncbi:hypothetical protein MNBD_GAMMA26-1168 [hydrothermal vent metagenome]|uniref:Uncharacterized protein n=1 Tax=hydrothermal vent metagenome TaxID=652676 RepID=A0A3B1BCR2_9ZZZZ